MVGGNYEEITKIKLSDFSIASRMPAHNFTVIPINYYTLQTAVPDPTFQFLYIRAGVFSSWDIEAFNITTMFASNENVAVFGDFRYKSKSLGKVVASPFAILVKVVDGKVSYVLFMEDTYATASSFRKDGTWTVQTKADAEPLQV